jgi:hypothetical protein
MGQDTGETTIECQLTSSIQVSIRVLVFNIKYTLFLRVRAMPGLCMPLSREYDRVVVSDVSQQGFR